MKGAEARRALDCLRTVPLFEGLPDDKLAWISERGEKVKLGVGSVIARQGDPPDGFYVVMEGETEWTRRVGQEDVFVIRLGEGSIFAELIMVLGAPYPTTGHAVTDVGLLKLDAPSFWTNLIDNAADAVDGRGNITVRTFVEEDRIVVEVVDDGPGIPPEARGRVFEPFYTTKEVGAGTGLGLDVVRRIVVGYGGGVSVRSEPGETRFTVGLPADTRRNGG